MNFASRLFLGHQQFGAKCVRLILHPIREDVVHDYKAKLMSYMKLLDVPLGLLINFHEMKLVDGVHRLMLPGANQ